MDKPTLEEMINDLSKDEREKIYQQANGIISLLKFVGIENSAVCQLEDMSNGNPKLVYAIVIPENNFPKIIEIIQSKIKEID